MESPDAQEIHDEEEAVKKSGRPIRLTLREFTLRNRIKDIGRDKVVQEIGERMLAQYDKIVAGEQ
jgi:hypothetical protein